MREVAVPYAARHGIDLVELERVRRDGTVELKQPVGHGSDLAGTGHVDAEVVGP